MPPFFCLFLLVSFASVGAVLFTPALPTIQQFFNISVAESQLSVTAYLIGYAIGQLPYGPLANRFGRKKALYIGITLSIIGALLCALSSLVPSFSLLILARFLQALGACVGLKVSFTMVADLYEQTAATKMIAKLMVAFAIMPGLSIATGGFLTQTLGWESCFYFLALFGFFVLYLVSKLPETAKTLDANACRLSAIVTGYTEQISNRRLVYAALIMGLGTAVIYIFAAKAPFIGITKIGLSPREFGLWNLIPPIGMLLGSFVATKLAGRFPVMTILKTGIFYSFLFSLCMLVPFLLGYLSIFVLFFPMILIYTSESLVFANITSLGLTSATNKSNASALLNFLNMSVGSIGVLSTQAILPEWEPILPLSFCLAFGIMFHLYTRLKKIS